MDHFDSDDRPSIFSRPDADEADAPRRPTRPASAQSPMRWSLPPELPDPAVDIRGAAGPSRRLVAAMAGAGLLVMLIGGFVIASVLRPGGDGGQAVASPSNPAVDSGSPSASDSAGVSPSGAPTAAPSPTPLPTPAGPPQDVAVGAWATVTVDELNVRSAAGTDAASNAILVRGAIVHVADGPVVVADLNWYRIASLGGTVGWATSGWVAEPFMTTLVEDPTLIRCGEVGRAVFDVSNGVVSANDPLAIGNFALPAAKFSDVALGVLELLRGVGEEACFTARLGPDGLPAISVEFGVMACGHAVAEGDLFRLRPSARIGYALQTIVKDPVLVHPAVLAIGPESRMSSNIRAGLAMMASTADAAGCLSIGVTPGLGDVQAFQSVHVDVIECSIVSEFNANNLRLSPAAGGAEIWFKLSSLTYQSGTVPLGVATRIGINVKSDDNGTRGEAAHLAWVYDGGQDPACS